MVTHRPGRPPCAENRFGPFYDIPQGRGIERQLHELKIVATMEMFTGTRVFGTDADHVDVGNLPDQVSIGILIHQRPEFFERLQSARLVAAVGQLLPVKRVVS